MKRNLFVVVLLMASTILFAQQDVTCFLGIPVDGSKAEMIRKLKEKGFVSTLIDKEVLEGEFNGTNVYVHVVTNKDKVCRIMLSDVNYVSETSIKIRFNNLCEQFKNNSKYVSLDDYTISDEEDIPYEISVHDKRYEAVFYQQINIQDTLAMANELRKSLLTKYTEEELENPTEEISSDILKLSMMYAIEKVRKKSVWFMISREYGKYGITMFYDNEYNRANGEDL